MGWAILGLLDLLSVLDQPHGEIADLAANVINRLAATQEADGNWRAVLGSPSSAPETSAAAFYVAACRHPAARSLGSPPKAVLKRAAQACVAALAPDGTCAGVSADVLPSWDITSYERFPTEPSPWAQGSRG